MSIDTASHKLGALESTVLSLQADVTEIKEDQKEQSRMLRQLLAHHNRQKGAVKFGKIIVGFVASSGFAGWLWEHFHK